MTISVIDTINIDIIEKLLEAMPLKSNISETLDLVPTMLHDFYVDFVLVLPQSPDTPQVAILLSKAITQLHTFLIDIRILSTNYQHSKLTHHYVENVHKFQ